MVWEWSVFALHTPTAHLIPFWRVPSNCPSPRQVSKLLGGQPLRLSLQGLDYMSDDPTDMHVLYLKVCVRLGLTGCICCGAWV